MKARRSAEEISFFPFKSSKQNIILIEISAVLRGYYCRNLLEIFYKICIYFSKDYIIKTDVSLNRVFEVNSDSFYGLFNASFYFLICKADMFTIR